MHPSVPQIDGCQTRQRSNAAYFTPNRPKLKRWEKAQVPASHREARRIGRETQGRVVRHPSCLGRAGSAVVQPPPL